MQQSQPNRKEKEDHEKDNPALSKVIERNIRTIIHLRTKAARERSLQEPHRRCHHLLFGADDFRLCAYRLVWDMDSA